MNKNIESWRAINAKQQRLTTFEIVLIAILAIVAWTAFFINL